MPGARAHLHALSAALKKLLEESAGSTDENRKQRLRKAVEAAQRGVGRVKEEYRSMGTRA
jgi:hypothetical protein